MFKELFELSQQQKKGLMFYLKGGHQVGGAVTKIVSDDVIEARNQQYGRIIILVSSIEAIAMP